MIGSNGDPGARCARVRETGSASDVGLVPMLPCRALPLVAVAMTSIIGFFLTDLVGELRAGRSIVYSLERGTDAVVLRLANVSHAAITEIKRLGEVLAFIKREQDARPPQTSVRPTSARTNYQKTGRRNLEGWNSKLARRAKCNAEASRGADQVSDL